MEKGRPEASSFVEETFDPRAAPTKLVERNRAPNVIKQRLISPDTRNLFRNLYKMTTYSKICSGC